MNEAEVLHAIEDRMRTRWPLVWDRQPPITIIFEDTQTRVPLPPFVRLYVDAIGDKDEAYAGSRIDYSKLGIITAQIFTKKGEGTTLGREIGAAIETIFAGKSFGSDVAKPMSGIICRECTVTVIRGRDRANAELSQVNARVPYEYHQSVETGD
jgi:hypothetical protein